MIDFISKQRVPLILVGIIFLGVFFRVYHFHDWLQFSPDQARDATLIENVLEGTAPFPLTGPQAGNTLFNLGPLYYEWQYISAALFGMTPQAMAYPDVLFSLLAIPLLYVFVRKYFSIGIALALTGTMSVSFFAITSSRFASNPNAIPFFLMLFLLGLLGMMKEEKQQKLLWPTLTGIGLGVGIQEHTLLLLSMPVVALGVLVWLWKKQRLPWKSFFVALFFVLILNTGQLIHEWQTGGGNIHALLNGISRSGGDTELMKNTGLIASCQIQANTYIVSSLEDIQDCGGMWQVFRDITRNKHLRSAFLENVMPLMGVLLSLLFSLGGYALWWRALWREKEPEKRHFLALLLGYQLVSFVIFIPVAGEMAVHYFIVLFFVPFLILGLWLEVLEERWRGAGKVIGASIVLLLIAANLTTVAKAGLALASGFGSDVNNSILGEIEPMAGYLIAKGDAAPAPIYLTGKKMYHKRFYKPLGYLVRHLGRELILADDKNTVLPSGTRVFYVAKTRDETFEVGDRFEGYHFESMRKFGAVTLYVLRQ